jgi:1-acyl-sn-glycerol-3-phosphate acyltransferase
MALFRKLILNVVFYSTFIPFTLLFPVAVFPWVLWGRVSVSQREAMRRLRLAMGVYGRVVIWVLPQPFVKVRLVDQSSEQDALRPYIIISNHRSASDAFLTAWCTFESIQIVNIWPFKIPVLGFLARLAGFLSVNEMPFETFSRRCGQLLDQGVSIIAFPEGTRSGNKVMGQFGSAMFRIALDKKIPIVPVCVSGSEDKPKRGSLCLNPGTILVHRLPTVRYEEFKDFSPFKLKNTVRTLMECETKIMDEQGRK